MNQYPMKPYMDQMATHGRYGDSMLVHMNPAEVQGIAALSPTGGLTINPVTGQPEAFLPFLAPILGSMGMTAAMAPSLTAAFGGTALAGIGATALSSGIGAGLATGIVTGDWDKAKMDFLGGALTGGMGAVPGLGESAKLADVTGATAGVDAAKSGVLAQEAAIESAKNFGTDQALFDQLASSQSALTGAETGLTEAIKESQRGVFGAFADAPVKSLKGMADMGFVVPKAISEGAKTAIDRERMEKAMYADVEAEKEKELQEAEGNIQRSYLAAQPDAVRGPSEYRKALSTYTPPYQYASQGGIVSLANGGQVQRLEEGGRAGASRAQAVLDEKAAQALESGDASSYLAYLQGLDKSAADYFAGLQGGEETPDAEDVPDVPDVPTSGYRVDPATGATVYFDDTRPSLAREEGAGVPYNIGAISNPFGGGYIGGYGTMGSNPGYKGVDPITIQANLRGRYAVDRPMGYMPGFEPEFRHFQSDLENIQVPSRQYAPQAAGPVMGTPYFGTMVDPASYLDEIGRYYSDIGSYRPTIGAAQPPVVEPPVVDDEEVVDEDVIDEEVVDEGETPTPPVGGISDIVVGNYQGGERQTPQTLTGDDLLESYIDQRYTERPIYHYDSKGEPAHGVPVVGKMRPGRYYHVNLAHEDAEASFATKQQAMDYLRNFYGKTGEEEETGRSGRSAKPKASEDAAKAKERERLAAIRRSAERQAQQKQTGRPTRGGMSVSGPSGETTYFSTGGQIPLGMDSPSGIAQADQAFVDARGIAAVPTDFSQRGASMEPREKSLAEIPQQDVMVLAEALLRNDIPPQLKDSIIMDFQSKHGSRALEEARMVILSQGDPAVQTSGLVRGQGDGKSDSIMGSIGDQEGAIAVSDGEYIVGADVVSAAGNGSTDAGAEFFEELSDNLRRGTTGTTEQTRKINPREMI